MSPHACNRFAAALPSEGAQSALGRPGGRLMTYDNHNQQGPASA